jgi:methionine sulfoxide reductase catalytic subunit
MLIRKPSDIPYSEVTPHSLYLRRREFIQAASGAAIAAAAALAPARASAQSPLPKLANVKKSQYSTTEAKTPFSDITSYNNFYEFGSDKDDPQYQARNFVTRPWTVRVEGLVNKPGAYDLDEFIKPYALEERIYRLRCVEMWSIVVPWIGIPLADIIKRLEPQPSAKFVEFTTLYDPMRMPGQKIPVLRWPYVEGLRMDEAMNPLTILAVGLYGSILPNQDGAPIRLVVPWKYGFKSIKSIVRIRFQEMQPRNTWQIDAPNEYGFYANVNPNVDHPRWSQATERRLGEFRRRPTQLFNGYAKEVAHMYASQDLRKDF